MTTDRREPSRSRAGFVVVGAVLVLVGLVALTGVLSGRDQSTGSFEGVTTLDLDLRSASVVIRAGDGDEVVVEKDVTTGVFGGSSAEEQAGSTLRLTQRCPVVLGFRCRGTYTLTVPADVEVRGSTTNGAIRIQGLEGTVDVVTTNGAVHMEDLAGAVSVGTTNGRIEGDSLATPSLRASTSNGAVRLGFVTTPTRLEVRTSNGGVEVVLPEDAPVVAVSAQTSNGDTVADVRTDPSSDSRFDISTSNGDIVVRYP